jgi:hypothetical protein
LKEEKPKAKPAVPEKPQPIIIEVPRQGATQPQVKSQTKAANPAQTPPSAAKAATQAPSKTAETKE